VERNTVKTRRFYLLMEIASRLSCSIEACISTNRGFANSNSCATGAPLPMKKWYTSLEEDNARDRFDASATSLSNSMIRMPLKHHCLSLADIGEARMGEFDPRLASPCLSS